MEVEKHSQAISTDEQIVAAYLEYKCVSHVCKRLHAGSNRVQRVLEEAGIDRKTYATQERDPRPLPEVYATAIKEYQAGAKMADLKRRHGVSYAMLYRWMDRARIERRCIDKRPRIARWWCWECGVTTPTHERFCCEEHRRAYRDALGPDTEIGAIYCLHSKCGKVLPYYAKKFCNTACQKAYFEELKELKDAQAQGQTPPAEARGCARLRDAEESLPDQDHEQASQRRRQADHSGDGRCSHGSPG